MVIISKYGEKWRYIINFDSKQFIKHGFNTKAAANRAARLKKKQLR